MSESALYPTALIASKEKWLGKNIPLKTDISVVWYSANSESALYHTALILNQRYWIHFWFWISAVWYYSADTQTNPNSSANLKTDYENILECESGAIIEKNQRSTISCYYIFKITHGVNKQWSEVQLNWRGNHSQWTGGFFASAVLILAFFGGFSSFF